MKLIMPMLTMLKADLISTIRNPSSIIFGILFPLIFIVVFGFIGQGEQLYRVAVADGTDSNSPIYQALKEVDFIQLETDLSESEAEELLETGRISAQILITSELSDQHMASYVVDLKLSAADPGGSQIVASTVQSIVSPMNLQMAGVTEPPITVLTESVEGRQYKQIDFILPGQLGFALMSTGIFGTAFLFVSLRSTLVLKRFSATPVRKGSILVGLANSKLLFAIMQAAIIIGVGYFFLDFTLVNGLETFLLMLLLSVLGLVIFLGLGLIVSSIAKDENSVPPMANLITLPQFLLAGTFFPIEVFPEWLQPISKILPLYYLNNALRAVSFEGATLTELGSDLGALLIMAIVIYAVAIKVFKWNDA